MARPDASLKLPALHASHGGVWWANAEGAVRGVARSEAVARATESPFLLINAPLIGQRLGYAELNGLDLLELFAFVHPAHMCVPTATGLAKALGMDPLPVGDEAMPAFIQNAAARMLATLDDPAWPQREGAWHSAMALQKLRWPWAGIVLNILPQPKMAERWLFSRLPEWEDAAPRPAPRTVTLDEGGILARLDALVGHRSEARPGQRRYAAQVAAMFRPRPKEDSPQLVLAQAGTGIGKTFGYLAPASLWAEQADGQLWISTYTKALQRQLAQETERLFPDPVAHRDHVVVRKGRENYLCLINLEDALQGGFSGRAAIFAQLVARWAAYTRDGDMVGGDLPGWLPSLFRRNAAAALTDRRGECIYAGCPHYRTCFVERSVRASQQARIVIGNHALVMVQMARPPASGRTIAPVRRIIFDEGHHVFDAADSMFSAAISGQELIELRRWILGPERAARGRRRGLSARLMGVASYDQGAAEAIRAAGDAAALLLSDGWLARVAEGNPIGPAERFLQAARHMVFARDATKAAGEADHGYGLETELAEPDGPLVEAALSLNAGLAGLTQPLQRLAIRLEAVLDEEPDWLDMAERARIEGAIGSLGHRIQMLSAWQAMLARVGGPADPAFVDWLEVTRIEGREVDVGMLRHWLDPARPFAETVLKPLHGALITSATLASSAGPDVDWGYAEARLGAPHLDTRVQHLSEASPFDYAHQAEVLLVNDIPRGDMAALASAYARLIGAAGGGALGLFGAIRRLRVVHARIADRLARDGLPVFAQHVDPMDTGTLVDMFRDDPLASLLGTDALRDGVDVPGESLRLVIMEAVPWPRPTIVNTARKLAFGGRDYEEKMVRAKLAQAFGRLIRRADDWGQFVLLTAAVPSRLLSAFPAETPILRLGLDDAVARVHARNSARISPVVSADRG